MTEQQHARGFRFVRPAHRGALLGALLLAAVGCGAGDGKVRVTGIVTFDGSPMPDGYVTFTPEGGGTPAAAPIAAGKFEFAVKPGAHRVEIEASHFVGEKNPIMGLQPREQYVPARYNSESTLRADVKAGDENAFTFDLTSKAE
ncbi:MAG: hypothetical protein JNL18_01475 [Planctomycetaceae bacterium]|nr:hypothetical protein [Planctomycetaceae bacterium]